MWLLQELKTKDYKAHGGGFWCTEYNELLMSIHITPMSLCSQRVCGRQSNGDNSNSYNRQHLGLEYFYLNK